MNFNSSQWPTFYFCVFFVILSNRSKTMNHRIHKNERKIYNVQMCGDASGLITHTHTMSKRKAYLMTESAKKNKPVGVLVTQPSCAVRFNFLFHCVVMAVAMAMAMSMAVAILPSAWWDNGARFYPCYVTIHILICRMLKIGERERMSTVLRTPEASTASSTKIFHHLNNSTKCVKMIDINGWWILSIFTADSTQKLLIPSHTRQFTLEPEYTHFHPIQC